jgi:hypothetical protein
MVAVYWAANPVIAAAAGFRLAAAAAAVAH